VASVLEQLESNEALLLMYLAGELPEADRAEVERMLAVDAGLRDQLERLREAQDWFSEEMATGDSSARLAVSEGAAVRRVGRAMRQWQARRAASAPAPVAAPAGLRYPWWAYPLAAAASVVIAFLVWWGNTDRPPAAERNVAVVTPESEDAFASADPVAIANYQAEMIAQSLGFGEYRSDGFGPGPGGLGAGDWDEAGSVYAAVAPTDANVLMLLNGSNPADENAAPDDEPI
jgi:anti-sigma factor RsiW